jgi:serine protease AprX
MELNKKVMIIALACAQALSTVSFAQQVKYWVAFKDKQGTPFTVSKPSEFLGAKAVSRRQMFYIPVHTSDLPVTPDYVAQVENVPNVRVLYSSKWLNGVVIALDSLKFATAALNQINGFSFVNKSEKVKRDIMVSAPVSTVQSHVPLAVSSTEASAYNYGGSFWQNRQIGVDCLHEKGFRGQNMTIAVMDAGFSTVLENSVFDSLRAEGRLGATYDVVGGGTNVYVGGDHGTYVLSCMAANKPGVAIGSAPKAKYMLFRTEEGPSETISEEYNWIRAAEYADSAGADILTTSLGYTQFDDPAQNHTYASLNGRTAPMSIAATMAARKGLFVLNSAGNEGANTWKYISVAADADSVCAVGAVDSLGNLAGFSSVGPTSDGRIKPDLVARGAGAYACLGNANCFYVNGTSFSAPILAGAVACYWQAHPSSNNMKLFNVLKQTALNAPNPNNSSGWGIPNVCALVPEGINENDPNNFNFVLSRDKSASLLNVNFYNSNYGPIKVGVYDLLGKMIMSAEPEQGDNTVSFSTSGMTDNIYLIKIETPGGSMVKKFVKQ